MDIWDRLSTCMKEKGVTAAELSRRTGIKQSNFTGWKKREYLPSADAMRKISEALCVSVERFYTDTPSIKESANYLLNTQESKLIDGLRAADESTRNTVIKMASAVLDAPRQSASVKGVPASKQAAPAKSASFSSPYDEKLSHKSKPAQGYKRVEGKAAAGIPINAIPDTDATCIPVPAKYLSDRYFIVQAQGDSMIGAGINSGDYCVFQKDAFLDNGRIMYVQVEGSADTLDGTIKRVYQNEYTIELHSENPQYPPLSYTIDSVRLMGTLADILQGDDSF